MRKTEIIREINQATFDDDTYNKLQASLDKYGDELSAEQVSEFFAFLNVLTEEEIDQAKMHQELAKITEEQLKTLDAVQAEYDVNVAKAYETADAELTAVDRDLNNERDVAASGSTLTDKQE